VDPEAATVTERERERANVGHVVGGAGSRIQGFQKNGSPSIPIFTTDFG
jgi:hypothetical protein